MKAEAQGRPAQRGLSDASTNVRASRSRVPSSASCAPAPWSVSRTTPSCCARDGRETAIDDSAAPIRRPDGPVLGAVLVFRDVREAARGGRAQSRLAAIVASSGDANLSKDLDGTIRSWNAGAQRLFGFTLGSDRRQVDHRDRSAARTPTRRTGCSARLREGRGTTQLLTVRLAKDGRRIPVSLTNFAGPRC
jgi:PAS domain S-box-containing protein